MREGGERGIGKKEWVGEEGENGKMKWSKDGKGKRKGSKKIRMGRRGRR